jgi:hypothetical protein
MSEKLTCSNDTLPDQSLLRTANDPHAAILRWADDHPLEAWAVVAAVRGAEPSAERGDTIIDVIVVQRIQVKPFTGKQIALVQNSSHRSCASRKCKRGFTMSDVPSDPQ